MVIFKWFPYLYLTPQVFYAIFAPSCQGGKWEAGDSHSTMSFRQAVCLCCFAFSENIHAGVGAPQLCTMNVTPFSELNLNCLKQSLCRQGTTLFLESMRMQPYFPTTSSAACLWKHYPIPFQACKLLMSIFLPMHSLIMHWIIWTKHW